MTKNNKAIATVEKGDVPAPGGILSPQLVNRMVLAANERIKQMELLQKAALQFVAPYHVADFNGRPWIDACGCKSIARGLGLEIKRSPDNKPVRWERTDEIGDYYFWEVPVICGIPGGEYVEETGTCSSRDKLLGTKGGSPKPIEEVVEDHIFKKANENGIVRATLSFFGIFGIKWDRLTAMTGGKLTPENCETSVSFRSGSTKFQHTSEQTKKLNEAWDKLVKAMGSVEAAEKRLQVVTKTAKWGGTTKIAEVHPNRVEWLCKTIDGIYKNLFGNGSPPTSTARKTTKTSTPKSAGTPQTPPASSPGPSPDQQKLMDEALNLMDLIGIDQADMVYAELGFNGIKISDLSTGQLRQLIEALEQTAGGNK